MVNTLYTEIKTGKKIIYGFDGEPAYKSFKGRVTQSMVNQYGSYQAAREALNARQTPIR